MVNTQYANQFGSDTTQKVGDTVLIRVPQPALIRNGRIMDIQAQQDTTVPVQITTELGVDTGATDAEMALQIDDYQEQFIDPKIPGLVTAVENAVMANVIPQVARTVGGLAAGASAAYTAYNAAGLALQAGAILDTSLAPKGSDNREMLVNTNAQVDIVTALSTLFNQQQKLGNQYTTGRMSKDTLGFDWDSSNLTPSFIRGTANGGYLVNGANQTGSSLIVGTGTGTLVPGDTFVIANVFDVHSQTKQSLPNLKNFTVTAAYAGGGGTLAISPAIVPTGPYQNVSAGPATGAAITVKGTAGQSLVNNIAFAKDAFYFVTAKMPNPPKSYGVDSATATWKGIQLRFMQGYDMTNGMFISRFDIMFGSGILRPELAVRIPSTITAY
jgi:P22 coat protein - gene protein 5